MQACVGDGLAAVADLAADAAAPRLDVLIVDAGSGDPGLPMSCPPAAFLVSKSLCSITLTLTMLLLSVHACPGYEARMHT